MSKERVHGMSIIVRTVTRITMVLIFLYGIYIVLHGHLTPGGGFAGGVIIALAFINLLLAYGREVSKQVFSKPATSVVEALGAIMFISLALLGLESGGFLHNFIGDDGAAGNLISAGTIPITNIAIALKVGAGMFGIYLSLILLQPFEKEDK